MDNINKALIEALRNGEKWAFNEIFYLYHKRIYSFCRNHFHSEEDAEEVVQDIFLKLWQRKHNIDISRNFGAYLYTIAKNTIYDSLNKLIKLKAEQDYNIGQPSHINDTENEVLFHDLENVVNKVIELMPERRREIFRLSRKDGLTNKEISEKLNISLKTVETHMKLALDYFRKVLASRVVKMILFLAFIVR